MWCFAVVEIRQFFQRSLSNWKGHRTNSDNMHCSWWFVMSWNIGNSCHCVKSFRIRSYSGPYIPALRRISPCSVQMWENTDQNNSEYDHFLRSVSVSVIYLFLPWTISESHIMFLAIPRLSNRIQKHVNIVKDWKPLNIVTRVSS